MAIMFLHLPPRTRAQLSMKRGESSTFALITRHDVIVPLPAFFHLTALHSCAFTSMLPSPLSSPPHLSLSLSFSLSLAALSSPPPPPLLSFTFLHPPLPPLCLCEAADSAGWLNGIKCSISSTSSSISLKWRGGGGYSEDTLVLQHLYT